MSPSPSSPFSIVRRYDLGSIVCEVRVPEPVASALDERYARYRTDAPVDLRCEMRIDDAIDVEMPPEIEYPIAQVDSPAGDLRYRLRRRDVTAEIDLAARTVAVASIANTYVAETPLRVAVSLLLPRLRGGLLLHSSGVVVDGRAFVFSGHSGAGKTTTVRLLSPRPPLGDDLVALVPGPTGGFVARSLPFAGEYGVVAPLEAPLARIAFLEQAPVNEAIPLSESDARARILRNTLAYVRDRETAQRLQDVAGQLAGSTPAIRLRFQRDPSMADAAFGPISDGRG